MHLLSDLSIRWKLLLIIMLSSGLALVMACIAFTVYDQHSAKGAMVRKLEVLAGVIADNSVSSLVFDDAQAAGQTLAALKAEPHIVAAAIYNAQSAPFALYHRQQQHFEPPTPAATSAHFSKERLEIFLPIHFNDNTIGTVYIHSDLGELDARLERYVEIGALFFVAACIVAGFAAVILQRLVTNPIDRLATVARAVSTRHDYGVRASANGRDELGELAIGFNEMLAEIQIRDADLEDQVRRRTSELLTAKEAAEAANHAKSTFLVHMSRELRTPVSSIIGMAELTLADGVTPDQRGYQEAVRESASNLLALFDNLMDLSRLEAGQLQISRDPFALRDTLMAPLKGLALRAHAKDLELAVHIAANAPDRLLGDAHRLRQIVVNLVGNAIKFTSFGEILLEVEAQQVAPGQILLRGSISDTGIGIAAEQQELIFAPFAQADPEISRQYGGTGLGLAICRDLVEMMAGELTVASQVGRGSTFRFSARFDLDPQIAPSPVLPTELNQTTALVADDNTTNRRITQQLLETWGLRVDTSFNGRDALHKLEAALAAERPYALLILDTVMAGMDPYELARRLQQDQRFAALHIIALAPTTTARASDHSKQVDFAGYLLKPVAQSELLQVVCSALGLTLESPQPPTAPINRPLRVLVAEDTPANQQFITALLEKNGHSALLAKNGREALAALECERFDLMLMDLQMPEMSGLEATERIRARERASGGHIPILALTAYALEEDEERCLAVGMNGYLSKPFKERQLFEAIDRILPSGQTRQSHLDEKLASLRTAFPICMERIWVAVAAKNGDELAQVTDELAPLLDSAMAVREQVELLGELARSGALDEASVLSSQLEQQLKELLRKRS